MEYKAVILGLFIFVVSLLIFYKKIEQAIANYKIVKKRPEHIYAHELVMQTGEILSRPAAERYPDMETNLAKVKQYYQRVNSEPVKIGDAKCVNTEKVTPILQSVK